MQGWVHREHWAPTAYWAKISQCQFFLSAEGQGVQAMKIFEALFVKSIPVCQRSPATEDLADPSGPWALPLLLVDAWDAAVVTPSWLRAQLREQKQLMAIDWHAVRRKLSVQGVMEVIRRGLAIEEEDL